MHSLAFTKSGLARALRASLAGACFTSVVAGSAGAFDLLYVAGEIPPSEPDARAIFEVERMGAVVEVIDDDLVQASDADGRDLIVISSSVASAPIGSKFTAASAPLISMQFDLFDDLGFTGTQENVDFGSTQSQPTIAMVGMHPLTAGLSGTPKISSLSEQVNWGVPGPEAIVAATLTGDATRATVFGYEAGANMASGTAPARRIGLFPRRNLPTRWTADTQDLYRAAVSWALGLDPENRVRIALIGDSITEGGAGGLWSYRRALWEKLERDECHVDMTGSRWGLESGMPGSFLYDRDHQGHSGFRTDEVAALLPDALEGRAPDYALIHLGTNDVHEGTSLTDAKENLRAIINQLRNANPEVVILLAQIIPHRESKDAEIATLNGYIADLASEEDTEASPILLVDVHTGYDRITHSLPDGIHPNLLGEQHIADRFLLNLRLLIDPYCEIPNVAPILYLPGLSPPGVVIAILSLASAAFAQRRRSGKAGSRPHG